MQRGAGKELAMAEARHANWEQAQGRAHAERLVANQHLQADVRQPRDLPGGAALGRPPPNCHLRTAAS
jgi:hypothetical protein